MSIVYVTSDWHIGHKGIASRFRTGFGSDAAHDYQIVENASRILKKRDVVLMLGDMAFTLEGLQAIKELPGRKILIRGNHDTFKTKDYLDVFEEIHGAYRYKNTFFTHIPIHPTELYRGFNVHGHCHRGGPKETQSGDQWWRYYNAILEFNNYQIVPVKHVLDSIGRLVEEYE